MERLWPPLDLAGRTMLALLFILDAIVKISVYTAAGRYMAAFGLPAWLLPFAIALEFGGSVLLFLGWRTRIAALALAAFCVITALVFHANFADRNETIHLQKDLALAGALLFIAARGAGAWSVDAWLRTAKGATTG